MRSAVRQTEIGEDSVRPFLVVATDVRGRLIRLGPAIEGILKPHKYPEAVSHLLAETVVLATTLASALKYDGVFTLQVKGDGPVSLVVADMTSVGDLRGYAQFDRQRLAELDAGKPISQIGSARPLLGNGHLVFTVDQGPDTDRYQGIVDLAGNTLDQCVGHYFRQSEQFDASLAVAVGRVGFPGQPEMWRAGGIMIQRLPDGNQSGASDGYENWQRTRILAESITPAELLDPALDPDDILFRLFHEGGVRVFEPTELRAKCRCSRQKVEKLLSMLDANDVDGASKPDRVKVTCEFCGRDYDIEGKSSRSSDD